MYFSPQIARARLIEYSPARTRGLLRLYGWPGQSPGCWFTDLFRSIPYNGPDLICPNAIDTRGWLLWLTETYRCWVCVTRLVIEFLLVDQQNSVKLFASDSVVRCSCDAPLMVVKALLACHFFWLLGWSKPNQIERDSRMENYGQSRKLLSWQCLFSDLVIEKTIAPCDFR